MGSAWEDYLDVIGWIVWACVAILTATQLDSTLRNSDGGVRILAGRTALALATGLLVTGVTNISKLHLLWFAPVAFLGTMFLTGVQMQRRLRALARHGGGLQEIGSDIPWNDAVAKVFRVVRFDPGVTTVSSDDKVHNANPLAPYGHLYVTAPGWPAESLLPICHASDFWLAWSVIDEGEANVSLDEHELLVTYQPERLRRDGRSASIAHMLHFVLAPLGTLDRYCATGSSQLELFGELVFHGAVAVPQVDPYDIQDPTVLD